MWLFPGTHSVSVVWIRVHDRERATLRSVSMLRLLAARVESQGHGLVVKQDQVHAGRESANHQPGVLELWEPNRPCLAFRQIGGWIRESNNRQALGVDKQAVGSGVPVVPPVPNEPPLPVEDELAVPVFASLQLSRVTSTTPSGVVAFIVNSIGNVMFRSVAEVELVFRALVKFNAAAVFDDGIVIELRAVPEKLSITVS